MKKLLLNDNDLMVILHCDQDTILDMVSKGMPHYYYDDHFYFNYSEVQEWLFDTLELGYIETQYQGARQYLESVLHETIDMSDLREQLKAYMKRAKGLSDDKLVWLYNNIGGEKYLAFYEYIQRYFPGIKTKNIFKYYLALLKSLLDTGVYKDSKNSHTDVDTM